MSALPLINITMPVFNRPELTRQAIEAVRKNTLQKHILTVVDNGSESETQNMLLSMKEQGKIDFLFRLEQNYGVAVASNVGWRMVKAPLYMKLDNDIIINSPDWYSQVYACMERINLQAAWAADFGNILNNPQYVKKREEFYGETHNTLAGAAILIPKTLSDIIGYWCEDYGLYGCEDGDYGVRLRNFGFSQYYYDHSQLMRHMGHDNEEMKEVHKLDKKTIRDTNFTLFRVNNFLYEQQHKLPNVPPQYIPKSFDGYVLRMEKNKAYEKIFSAIMKLHDEININENDLSNANIVSAINSFIYINNGMWEAASNMAMQSYARFSVSFE